MDLLRNTYESDEDDDSKPQFDKPTSSFSSPSSSKRRKMDPEIAQPHSGRFLPQPIQSPVPQSEALLSRRYVSKRERSLISAASVSNSTQEPDTISVSPVIGSVSDSNIRGDVSSLLKNKSANVARKGRIPEKMTIALTNHTKAVNAVHWSPTHAHLLASAGMDNSVCIWNPWTSEQRIARKFSFHSSAVKDVRWSRQGMSILSCGYDSSSRLADVEKGIETGVFREDQIVGVVKFHEHNFNLFLSGGSRGRVRLWDIRTGQSVHEYSRGLEPILDLELSRNGKQIICSSDVSRTNVSENSIIVWDIARQVPLSNQVYVEAYTCPCVRTHPYDGLFVAQSNGNYIAIFSSSPPFKLNKYKRFEGHGVLGFPIKCSFSLDGESLISGSSDGFIYFYNYRSSELIRKIKAYEQACIDVAVHPIFPNVVASCGWSGEVSVFE